MSHPSRTTAEEPEVAELVNLHPDLHLPVPGYGGRSLANIASTLWESVPEHPSPPPAGMLPPLGPSLNPFRGARSPGTVVVFLVDGLGWFPFTRWTEGTGERGARWRASAHPITTVFPTTTTAALTSLSTGAAPSTHGLVGYRQYLPRFGVVADLLRMSPTGVPGQDLLVHRDFRPDLLSGAPTVFRRGLPGLALSRDRFEGTGFTRVLYDGAEYVPYATAADFAHQLTHLLSRDHPPSLVFTYWDELDTIQHLRGPEETALFDLELSRVVDLVEHVAREVPAKVARTTTLLITGDHGQVPSGVDRQVRVDLVPAVAREMAHPLAGDRRAGFFAAKPGRQEALRAALEGALPQGSRLLRMEEAVGSGLFGPPPFHPELTERLGDLLALLPPPYGLTDLPPGAVPPKRHLFGAHGGLDPEELVVPLVAGTLSDLGPASSRAPPPGQR